MSRKYVRRFIRYHPSLFQDKKLVCVMDTHSDNVDLSQLARIIVRYRKAQSSDYLVLRLKKISDSLDIDFHEILVLNRISDPPDYRHNI